MTWIERIRLILDRLFKHVEKSFTDENLRPIEVEILFGSPIGGRKKDCNEKRDQCSKTNQRSRPKKSKKMFIVKPLNLPNARYLV
jgi:hypothetical protein